MDRRDLYDAIAMRKTKPADLEPYYGGNGRVDKCVRLFRTMGGLVPQGQLLDVGGAIGDLGFAMRDNFERRIVIDIAAENRRACELKGNEFYVCDVDREGLKPIETESVTVVTALDFIEHIVDPANFARECFRVLKRGGEMFINTPNIRFWEHIDYLVTTGRFPHTSGDREVFHGGHLAFYTRHDLEEIFGAAGFTDFKTFRDNDGYSHPPDGYVHMANLGTVKTQADYVRLCEDLGCPNLLFKAEKR